MKELVFLQNEQALTTSLKVAECFGKRHNDVLRAISASNQALRNFADSDKAFIKSSLLFHLRMYQNLIKQLVL